MIAWQFRFPSGALANGSSSFSQPGTMAYQVIGDQARLVADPGCFYAGNHLSLVADNQPPVPQLVHEIDQFAREMDWMADVVRGKAPLVSSGRRGCRTCG
jgi:hypothetical protein